MIRFIRLATAVSVATLTAVAPAAAAQHAPSPMDAGTVPTVNFFLLTPLPSELAVGETALVGVRVESREPFLMAIALSDAYYPGRGVRFDGSSALTGATSGDLYLTITGREPTVGLAAVADWPADEDWAAGAAPLAVRVGVRFPGGTVISTSYLFAVTVT